MAERFVNIDRDTPMLLPCDMREWVSKDDVVHFVIEVLENLDLSSFNINRRGSGSEQYPPRMMLGLLIYSYVMGVFSSRRIERMTYQNISFRYLCANTHPDHDTIAKFRRENFQAVSECFLQILELARELKLLKVGIISVDGSHIKANASKFKNISYERSLDLKQQLDADIQELLKKAEEADAHEEGAFEQLPEELSRLETLREKVHQAQLNLEKRVKDKADQERDEYERRVKEREKREHKGRFIKPPAEKPKPEDQANMTDPDSRLMRKSIVTPCEQSYNVQASIDAEGSYLALAGHVCQSSNDQKELEKNVRNIPATIGKPTQVLADNGYLNGKQIKSLTRDGYDIYVATGAEDRRRQLKYDFRSKMKKTERPGHNFVQDWLRKMNEKMTSENGRKIYSLRKQTVEPVFGIIKEQMGFRRFNLRGLKKVEGEWNLVLLSYNMKKIWSMLQQKA